MKKFVIILFISIISHTAYSQEQFAIKTNLLYGAVTFTPNLDVEMGLGKQTTIDVSGGYNWFNRKACGSTKKLAHWIVVPEFRYYLCQRFNGHFFGIHGIATNYNIGGHNLPLLFEKGSQDYRYQGNGYGVGVSYGYQFMLSKNWNLELTAGVGYIRMSYDKYAGRSCGERIGKDTNNYFGPTKLGVNIMYMLF